MTQSDRKVVLIAGASTGIGRACATRLARSGHTVFGTSRSAAAGGPGADGVQMVAMDVCSDESVAACVADVLGRAGQIDVLINNAGYQLMGAIEETRLDEAKAQFETNFFGAVRLTKAVLPAMRARRSGKIINMSSIFGFSAGPFLGFYSASKHALEGYSDALRHEVAQFGISVSVIEPSGMKTPINQSNRYTEPIADYAATRETVFNFMQGEVESVGGDPEDVARLVEKIVDSPSPRLRYPIGKNSRMTAIGRRLLPEPLVERLWRRGFQMR